MTAPPMADQGGNSGDETVRRRGLPQHTAAPETEAETLRLAAANTGEARVKEPLWRFSYLGKRKPGLSRFIDSPTWMWWM